MTPIHTLFLLLFLSGILWGTSAEASLPEAIAQAQALKLYQDPYWLKLLHYRSTQLRQSGFAVQGSLAHSLFFFMTPNGATDPAAELYADLKGFYKSAPLGDNHPQCRLPARLSWLEDHLSALHDVPYIRCTQYQRWRTALNTQHISLIFASDYTNNPSSMFGHTFLRLDSAWPEPDPLLSYAISYTANTHESNGLIFAIKGLTGGYPGQYSLMPYYDKVKQYIAIEDRDLWEYSLRLSKPGIDRLLKHVWELQDVAFPYYFFSDNCAYELLKLLEIGQPHINLSAYFNRYAIPADTVRRIAHYSALIGRTYYRPAEETQLEYKIATNPRTINQRAKMLIENHAPHSSSPPLTPVHEAAALETAINYLGLQHDAPTQTLQQLHAHLLSLLQQRAQLGSQTPLATMPWPASNPVEGHDSAELYMSGGTREGYGIIEIGGRPAYNDPTDDSRGYRSGASIDFFHIDAQYRQEDHQLHLNQFTVIDIQSYADRSILMNPLSWQLHLSAQDTPLQNQKFNSQHTHVLENASAGMGLAWADSTNNWIVHSLIEPESWIGPGTQGGAIGIGINTGLQWQQQSTHTQFNLNPLCLNQHLGCWWRSQFSWNQSLSRNLALRAQWLFWLHAHQSLNTTTVGIYHYF